MPASTGPALLKLLSRPGTAGLRNITHTCTRAVSAALIHIAVTTCPTVALNAGEFFKGSALHTYHGARHASAVTHTTGTVTIRLCRCVRRPANASINP